VVARAGEGPEHIGRVFRYLKEIVPLSPANPEMLVSARLVMELKLFGEWRSSDEVCEIWRCEPLNVSNAKIPKNIVNRRHRFLTNDVAKASFKFVLKCQPRKCG
jgi:hypothetical protein